MINGFTLDFVSVGVMTDVLPATPRGPMTPNAMAMSSRQTVPADKFGYPTCAIAANVSLVGAEIRVYDLDSANPSFYGTELDGAETCPTAIFSTKILPGNQIAVQVMLDGYEEAVTRINMPNQNATFDIILSRDMNA